MAGVIRFESVDGPLLFGGAVVDGRELVIWLRPSIWLAARDPEMSNKLFEHGFNGAVVEALTWPARNRRDH